MPDPERVIQINNNMRKCLFEALKKYVEEEHKGRYSAAASRLGIPRWQMTRWFSVKSKSYRGWSKPRIHILKQMVLADVHPISIMARAVLINERVPLDFCIKPLTFKSKEAEALYYWKIREATKLDLEAAELLVEEPPERGPRKAAGPNFMITEIVPPRRHSVG